MVDEEKIRVNIIRAKKLIAKAVKIQSRNTLIPLRRLNKELSLVVAGFKCQKCGSEEKLQLHHLILRMAKNYMDFWRYVGQRHYWANQIILCKDCHDKFHGRNPSSNEDCIGILKEEYIKKIKEKYKYKAEEEITELSSCCGVPFIEDSDFCSSCKEHSGVIY